VPVSRMFFLFFILFINNK